MKTVKLLAATIRNFKGIKSFEGNFDSAEAWIGGENGTGKSTILDAVCWCLDGKNAAGVSDQKFNVKTLDSNNKPITKLQHMVALTYLVDGVERKFKRVYYELHQKKRGTNESVSKGNTTDYFVDDIEKKESEFKASISSVFGVTVNELTMLTSPLYFLNRLHWEKRREILCDMAGEVEYSDLVGMEEFAKLEIELNKHTPDEYKKHCTKQKNTINKQITSIPHRMDELDKLEGDLSTIDFAGIDNKISQIDLLISDNNAKLKEVTDDNAEAGINEKFSAEINEITALINKANESLNTENNNRNTIITNGRKKFVDEIEKQKALLDEQKAYGSKLKSEHEMISSSVQKAEHELESMTTTRDNLRASAQEIIDREFKFSSEDGCLTCGRPFSDTDKSSMERLARIGFDKINQDEMDVINAKGRDLSARILEAEKSIELFNNQKKSIWTDVENQSNVVNYTIDSIKVMEIDLQNMTIDTKSVDKIIAKLEAERDKLEKDLKARKSEKEDALKSVENNAAAKIRASFEESTRKLEAEKKELLAEASKKGQIDLIAKQKKELLNEEDNLSVTHAEWEEQLFLCELLIKAYVSKIEESVNKMFSTVKFKLFKKQQNGGIDQCCQVLLNGVPDGDINTAGTVNAGIDIINSLQNHYNLNAPIIIDNRESITELIDTQAQIINLIKDSSCKQLTQKIK